MRQTKLIIAASLLFGPLQVLAGPIFDFVGTCNVNCAQFGLTDGDAFDESGVLGFVDGTSTAAGSTFSFADIDYFVLFGFDFLTGNSLRSNGENSFIADDTLGSFIIDSATNAFCYHFAGSTCSGGRFDTRIPGGDPNGVGNFVLAKQVPEPGTLALLGIGLFGMGLATRKKV